MGGHHNPTYAAMIASVDESVGRVMALLDELKLADNTVLIFSSDNGGVGGYVREGIKKAATSPTTHRCAAAKAASTKAARASRSSCAGPASTKPGTTCDVPAIHVDVYPDLPRNRRRETRRRTTCSTVKASCRSSAMPAHH